MYKSNNGILNLMSLENAQSCLHVANSLLIYQPIFLDVSLSLQMVTWLNAIHTVILLLIKISKHTIKRTKQM